MWYTTLIIVHIFSCFFLIAVVLLQQGKGSDVGAVFGGSSQTIFGSSGAGNLLTKLTTGTAIVFMLTSLLLTYGTARETTKSVFDDAPLTPSTSAAPQGTPTTQPSGETTPTTTPAGGATQTAPATSATLPATSESAPSTTEQTSPPATAGASPQQ
ncbi:MAG: preprotein translocase subunit SecG [Candidatus Binatia bacterium]|nr:preprotein translocase subunit SecG [Candidatus Binatia bacterium]